MKSPSASLNERVAILENTVADLPRIKEDVIKVSTDVAVLISRLGTINDSLREVKTLALEGKEWQDFQTSAIKELKRKVSDLGKDGSGNHEVTVALIRKDVDSLSQAVETIKATVEKLSAAVSDTRVDQELRASFQELKGTITKTQEDLAAITKDLDEREEQGLDEWTEKHMKSASWWKNIFSGALTKILIAGMTAGVVIVGSALLAYYGCEAKFIPGSAPLAPAAPTSSTAH